MLTAIRVVHTIIWTVFVGCILAIWVFAWRGDFGRAAVSIGIVLVEVVVLTLNGGQCPLTSLAARYTDDRRGGFDICLPGWLVLHNSLIWGALYAGAIAATVIRWAYAAR